MPLAIAESPSWLDAYEPMSAFHLVVVGACVAIMVAACGVGRALRDRPAAEHALRWWWAWSTVAVQAFATGWWLLPERFNLERSVPLHLCRLVVWLAPVALLNRARWPRSILYFLALPLCTQAFLTPVFTEGPAHLSFWLYWLCHIQIVGPALYDVIVRGFRPNARDLAVAFLAGLAYAIVIFFVNWGLGTNYAGLGRTVFENPNLAQSLGDWPLRPLWITLIGLVWGSFFWVVWVIPWGWALGRGLPVRAGGPDSSAAPPPPTPEGSTAPPA